MDAIVTPQTEKLARNYKLTPEELAFADLVAVGWSIEDAWAIALRKGTTWTKKARNEAIDDLYRKESVQKRITETKGVLSKKQTERIRSEIDGSAKALLERATNKESKIVELQAKLEASSDTNEWLKINQQIIDVTRMKQDEVKTEDTTIHHFLPVHYPTGCKDCLYSKCDKCKYKKAYKPDNIDSE